MQNDSPESPILTVDECAKLLRISRGSAFEAVRRGEIPSIRIGRRLLVPRARLIALIESASLQPIPQKQSGKNGLNARLARIEERWPWILEQCQRISDGTFQLQDIPQLLGRADRLLRRLDEVEAQR